MRWDADLSITMSRPWPRLSGASRTTATTSPRRSSALSTACPSNNVNASTPLSRKANLPDSHTHETTPQAVIFERDGGHDCPALPRGDGPRVRPKLHAGPAAALGVRVCAVRHDSQVLGSEDGRVGFRISAHHEAAREIPEGSARDQRRR